MAASYFIAMRSLSHCTNWDSNLSLCSSLSTLKVPSLLISDLFGRALNRRNVSHSLIGCSLQPQKFLPLRLLSSTVEISISLPSSFLQCPILT